MFQELLRYRYHTSTCLFDVWPVSLSTEVWAIFSSRSYKRQSEPDVLLPILPSQHFLSMIHKPIKTLVLAHLPGKGNGNTARNGIVKHPGTDGDHGGTAVLELTQTTTLGNLDTEGVPSQITGKTTGLEAGGDTALVHGPLAVLVGELVQLHDGNGREHLGQTSGGDVLHGLEGGHGGEVGKLDSLADAQVFVGGNVVERPAEFVEEEAEGGNHGRAAVLELGGTEEGACVLRSPLAGQEIPLVFSEEADGREIADGLGSGRKSRRGGRLGSGRKGGGRSHERGKDGGLHRSENIIEREYGSRLGFGRNASRRPVRVVGPASRSRVEGAKGEGSRKQNNKLQIRILV